MKGRYEICLPCKDGHPPLLDSHNLATTWAQPVFDASEADFKEEINTADLI